MNIEIIEGYPERIEIIESLFRSFGGFNENVFEHSLRNRANIICVYAYDDELLIGCKIPDWVILKAGLEVYIKITSVAG